MISIPEPSRIKSNTKWSPEEDARLDEMLASHAKYRKIAVAIGRSENAITSRVAQRRIPMRERQKPFVQYPTARVPKQLVIDWYELGWRVLGIGATDCVLEWRLSRAPEYPHACKIEATAPVRELEPA